MPHSTHSHKLNSHYNITTSTSVVRVRMTTELDTAYTPVDNSVDKEEKTSSFIRDNSHDLIVWGTCIVIFAVIIATVSAEWAAFMAFAPALHDSLSGLRS